ncbi:hypothetical protein MBAV_004118 [Candidatus Magnetobacterium bavaricum]|uniref:Uncharacterized protein n=1 Tax=Candidatus Magnetobacterium bavaricum TaxID=29290 RepID=A0A0F3GPD3_9BACT|nr:hypothetical protein MBAV_004118 [Candidatus Magnetobacterium bavaricum]
MLRYKTWSLETRSNNRPGLTCPGLTCPCLTCPDLTPPVSVQRMAIRIGQLLASTVSHLVP